MGYTNGSSSDSHSTQSTRQKGYKGPPGIGYSLTADEHYHIKNKRLTNVSAPIDNSDATTKKFVTDLLKTKAGTTYVNNELAALKKRVGRYQFLIIFLLAVERREQPGRSE